MSLCPSCAAQYNGVSFFVLSGSGKMNSFISEETKGSKSQLSQDAAHETLKLKRKINKPTSYTTRLCMHICATFDQQFNNVFMPRMCRIVQWCVVLLSIVSDKQQMANNWINQNTTQSKQLLIDHTHQLQFTYKRILGIHIGMKLDGLACSVNFDSASLWMQPMRTFAMDMDHVSRSINANARQVGVVHSTHTSQIKY